MGKNKKKDQQQQQEKKSKQKFRTLLEAGVALIEREAKDRDAEGAEKMLQAVHAAPSVWTKHRFFAFQLAMTRKMIDDVTPEEVAMLHERFVENESEPTHFRVEAAYCLSDTYFIKGGNLSTSMEYCRTGLDLIQQASSDDENTVIMCQPYITEGLRPLSSDGNVSLKSLLNFYEKGFKRLLLATELAWANVNPEVSQNGACSVGRCVTVVERLWRS